MKIPRVKKTFCCIDLTIGAAIIGWLGSLFALIDLAALVYHLTGPDATFDLETVFSIVQSLLLLAISVCLMLATQSENRRLVIPWLVVTTLNVISMNMMVLCAAVSNGPGYSVLILGICDFLFIYVWLCIYSYYYELRMSY